MSDLDDLAATLVEVVASNMLRRYGSEYLSEHLTWRDFEGAAREDVAATLRKLANAEKLMPPAVAIFHGEATGRPSVYADEFPQAAAHGLRALARRLESSAALGVR